MRILLALLIALVLGPVAGGALAEEIRITAAEVVPADDSLVLSANFEFEFTGRLEDALNQGIPLYFLIEFDLTRPRWYWFDEQIAHHTQKLRLWYHALTRQYRLSSGTLHQSYPSLDEAHRAISRLRNMVVAERVRMQPSTEYWAALRMHLDTTELPKPFQVSALANRDWTLASGWRRWRFNTLEPAQ